MQVAKHYAIIIVSVRQVFGYYTRAVETPYVTFDYALYT